MKNQFINLFKISSLLIFLFLIIISDSCLLNTQDQSKPNIIIILVDDLGWNDLSYMGSEYYETPFIDKLAKQGMKFTHAYVTAPNCAPSRASLLTGQYTPRHNIFTVNSSERGKSQLRKIIPVENQMNLNLDKLTIADVLRDHGYKTACIGKWHLGKPPQFGPTAQGFDINIGGHQLGHPKSYFSPYKNNELKDGPDGEYLTDRLTEEAVKFIDENNNDPFFLYLSHYGVHTPIQAKQKMIQKFDKKKKSKFHNNSTYAAMIESIDQSVGKIMQKLELLELSENTVVIFLSDNGGLGKVTSMNPLRGSKGMFYEGGIRIPMIITWKDQIESNSTCEEDVICIDILPTVLSIIGKDTIQQEIDGVSLIPLLFNKDGFNREAIYWHFPAYLEGNYEGAREIGRAHV